MSRGNLDVFLSYSGLDTGENFTNHLYQELLRKGRTGRLILSDVDSLSARFDVRDPPTIAIVVLSENYAKSVWGLQELLGIMKSVKQIYPVYYHVHRSDVKHQKGFFNLRHYQKVFDKSKLMEFKTALTKVAGIKGYNVKEVAGGYESQVIDLIVSDVLEAANIHQFPLLAAPHNVSNTCDVFIISAGDTRKRFSDHLYATLRRHGISVVRDKERLEKEQNLNSELHKEIKHSKIGMPVFSPEFAGSAWCLRKVEKMLECCEKIIPLFYNVKASDVMNQEGSFDTAFKDYEQDGIWHKQQIVKWRIALRNAAERDGYPTADW